MTALNRHIPPWSTRSARARFAWVTGLSGVLFAVLLSFWLAQDQRHQLKHAVSESARREAVALGQIVSVALGDRQRDIRQLVSRPDVASGLMDPGSMRLTLERIRATRPEFEWLALTNAQGKVIVGTGARLEGHSFADAPWFVSGMQGSWLGQPQAAGPLAPFLPMDVDGRPVQLIDMAEPVIDNEGHAIGVVVGMLNWRWVRDIHKAVVADDEGLVNSLLLTPDGKVVVGPAALMGQRLQPPGFEALGDGASAQVIDWPDLGPQLTAIAPMRWAAREGKPPLVMVLRQAPDLVFGPANALWQRLLLLGVLASGLFMLLSWWLAGRITQPLQALARTATALREGEEACFEQAPDQVDEIAALSSALQDMHSRLSARVTELANYRDHLEETVAQRTEQLQAARDKAEAATKAKSAFIANMSHEIRTPMNAIMSVTYLMQQGALMPGQAERLKTVHEAAEHLLDIVNNILDLSKIEAGMFTLTSEDFDLGEVLRKVQNLVEVKAREKQLQLVVEVGDCPARLHGDPVRLTQVLINLLSNAVKFTEVGEVRLLVRQVADDARPANLVKMLIEVHDTGVGIAPDKAGKLFNAFVQADDSTTRRFGGTGLGLAITRSLVELMGGRIGVRSQEGKGSVFWCHVALTLSHTQAQVPQAAQALDLSAEEACALLRQRHLGARVLLAEDNPVNSMLALELLAMAGVDAVPARHGAEAVDMVRQGHFDLVLMDMHMPVMDGLQATREIRQMPERAGLPIVAMTASVLQDEKDACMAAGMNGHLAKPIDTQALFQTLLHWFGLSQAGVAVPDAAARQA